MTPAAGSRFLSRQSRRRASARIMRSVLSRRGRFSSMQARMWSARPGRASTATSTCRLSSASGTTLPQASHTNTGSSRRSRRILWPKGQYTRPFSAMRLPNRPPSQPPCPRSQSSSAARRNTLTGTMGGWLSSTKYWGSFPRFHTARWVRKSSTIVFCSSSCPAYFSLVSR